MPRTATICPAVFQRENEIVSEGTTRTEAFAQVAQERGQRAGTVAAHYYRTARSQGQAAGRVSKNGRRRRPKARTAAGRPRATTRRSRASTAIRASSTSNHDDIAQIAAQIATLTEQLVKQIQDRDSRLHALLS